MGLANQDFNTLDCYKKIEVHGEGEKKHKESGKAPNPHEEPHSFEPCE
jgi:hypothetical protein